MLKFIERLQGQVEERGWKRMPLVLYKGVYYRIKYFTKIAYIKNILQNNTLAKIYPFKKPAILLLSCGRSGSSWVGKILSFSPDIAYLREPITQVLLKKLDYKNVIGNPLDKDLDKDFQLDKDLNHDLDKDFQKNYKRFADQAFSGIPPFYQVVRNSPDFFPLLRSGKHLLIKEVNPLGSSFFSKRYSPKMIILLRHPAGVADSRMRIGWLSDKFEYFGYCYGIQMSKALQGSQKTLCKVLIYEDVARNPRKEFSKLFDLLNVRLPPEFDKIIDEYCKQKNEEWKPYNTKRSSHHEVHKWKRNLDKYVIEEVKKGYMRSGLNYYRDQKDWEY